MSVWEFFKAGCELLAGLAQWVWDSASPGEQFLVFAAGTCLLGAFLGWTAGKIALWQRDRQQRTLAPEQIEGTLAQKQAREDGFLPAPLTDLEIARLSEWRSHPDIDYALGRVSKKDGTA